MPEHGEPELLRILHAAIFKRAHDFSLVQHADVRRVGVGQVAHLRRELHDPHGVRLVRQTLVHVLVRQRDDREPQRKVFLQRIFVRVVRDVVHHQPRRAPVKRTAAVIRDALELLLLTALALRARRLFLSLRLSFRLFRVVDVFLLGVGVGIVRLRVIVVGIVVVALRVGFGERLLALALVAKHEHVPVIAARVLQVQRAVAVEHERARVLGQVCGTIDERDDARNDGKTFFSSEGRRLAKRARFV